MIATLPEQDMLDQLCQTSGQGTFEAHITIAAENLAERERFRATCEHLGVKCVVIELPAGQTRSQPMTSTYHRGTVAEATHEVAGLARAVRAAGFTVTRVKLEAVITNEGVPADEDAARRQPRGNYFEFHVKVTLPEQADLDDLRSLCATHEAHLSTNALKRSEGNAERFITQRIYGTGRLSAEAVFERLLADLTAKGYTLSNRLREYTIFDSNAAVDAGWIEEHDESDS